MRSFLTDEKGNPSSARLALWLTLPVTLGLIAFGAVRPDVVWNLLETVLLSLIGWAGGPRVMEYLTAFRKEAKDASP
jgi:hypothetical protein